MDKALLNEALTFRKFLRLELLKNVFISVIIILVFYIFSWYLEFTVKKENIKKNFQKERCKPENALFVGSLAPKDKSSVEFMKDNLRYCADEVLKTANKAAFEPIYRQLDVVRDTLENADDSMHSFRKVLKMIKESMSYLITTLTQNLLLILQPIQRILVKTKDVMNKMIAVIFSGVYFIYDIILSIKSIIANIIYAGIRVCVYLSTVIIGLMVAGFFTGGASWAFASVLAVFLSMIMTYLAINIQAARLALGLPIRGFKGNKFEMGALGMFAGIGKALAEVTKAFNKALNVLANFFKKLFKF